jgi:hypothetical protein
MPVFDNDGKPSLWPNGTQQRKTWTLSDLDVARALFSKTDPHPDHDQRYWPGMDDERHGYVPGLRLLPEFRCVPRFRRGVYAAR